MAHSTEHDGYNEGHENEIYRGQIAYNRLIEAVANGDAETAKTAYEQAEDFMVNFIFKCLLIIYIKNTVIRQVNIRVPRSSL